MILTIDYIRQALRAALQHVIVVGFMLDQGGSCLMHALNRVVACHAEGPHDVNLPGLLTFSKFCAVEKDLDRFCDAVCAEALSDVVWTQFGTICPQQERRLEELVEIAKPNWKKDPRRSVAIREGLSVIMGDTSGHAVPHESS